MRVVELGPCFDLGLLGSVNLISNLLKNPENGFVVSDGFSGTRAIRLFAA